MSLLDAISRTPVDPARVKAFPTEAGHRRLAMQLSRETAQWAVALGSDFVGESAWTTRQAILAGQIVRLAKLWRTFLRSAKKHEAEAAWIISRSMIESIITLQYLVRHGTETDYDEYQWQSLQHSRRTIERIDQNVVARGGDELPIEVRLRAAALRRFEQCGLAPDSVPAKKIRDWGGKDLYERARAVGLGEAYLGIYSGPSHSVHGGWLDLVRHHLVMSAEGRWYPNWDPAVVRPQLLNSLSRLSVETYATYVGNLQASGTAAMLSRLDELLRRVQLADDLHEAYLSGRGMAA